MGAVVLLLFVYTFGLLGDDKYISFILLSAECELLFQRCSKDEFIYVVGIVDLIILNFVSSLPFFRTNYVGYTYIHARTTARITFYDLPIPKSDPAILFFIFS